MNDGEAMVDMKVKCPECGFREWVPEEKENIKLHISEYGVLNPTAKILTVCPNCGVINWNRIEQIVERGAAK